MVYVWLDGTSHCQTGLEFLLKPPPLPIPLRSPHLRVSLSTWWAAAQSWWHQLPILISPSLHRTGASDDRRTWLWRAIIHAQHDAKGSLSPQAIPKARDSSRWRQA